MCIEGSIVEWDVVEQEVLVEGAWEVVEEDRDDRPSAAVVVVDSLAEDFPVAVSVEVMAQVDQGQEVFHLEQWFIFTDHEEDIIDLVVVGPSPTC